MSNQSSSIHPLMVPEIVIEDKLTQINSNILLLTSQSISTNNRLENLANHMDITNKNLETISNQMIDLISFLKAKEK